MQSQATLSDVTKGRSWSQVLGTSSPEHLKDQYPTIFHFHWSRQAEGMELETSDVSGLSPDL